MWFQALGGCMQARNTDAISPHVYTTMNFVASIIFWGTDGKENNPEMPQSWEQERERTSESKWATKCTFAVMFEKKVSLGER